MNNASDRQINESLHLSLLDAFLYALMVGLGETYLPAYALSVGLGEVFAGILSSLPLVSGALLQLFAPKGLQKIGSHKSWVVITVVLQAAAYLPLVWFSYRSEHPDFLQLFLILTLYWGAGFAAGPAWNYWMGKLVPQAQSAKYFSRRTRLVQFGILLGLVIGGVALHNKVNLLPFTSVFSTLFLIAFLLRAFSSFVLSKKVFKSEWHEPTEILGVKDSWDIFFKDPIKKKFFLQLFPYMTAVYISAPFVTPYMLAQLKFDYGSYMIAIAALMLGKITALTMIEKWGAHLRGLKIFTIGVLAVSPAPVFWALSHHYSWVLFLQFTSGLAWACIEVGLALIFFQDLGHKEKVPILTIYNLINATGIIVGTFIGGQLLWLFGQSIQNYLMVFVLGGLVRMLCSYFLLSSARLWSNSIRKA